MKKVSLFLAVIMLAGMNAWAQKYVADAEKSTIKWYGAKVSGEHYGTIDLKSGSLELNGDKILNGEFVIDMATIVNEDLTTEEWNKKLVDHLKSDDFFGVAKYPTTKFVITKAEAFKGGKAKVTGDLTIKGITKPVIFETVKDGNAYTAEIKVDRTLYDIRYGSGKFFDNLGDKMIDDHFTLTVKLVVK